MNRALGLPRQLHLGHKIGTVEQAMEARADISKKVSELTQVGSILPMIPGAGFDSYQSAKEYAEEKHRQRFDWFKSVFNHYAVELEDGGIKSLQSIERKTGNRSGFQVSSDFSRFRIVTPDLRTLFDILNDANNTLSNSAEYWVYNVKDKYSLRSSKQTFFSGVFLGIVDANSNPRYLYTVIPDELIQRLGIVTDHLLRIANVSNLHVFNINRTHIMNSLNEQQKRKLQDLEIQLEAILENARIKTLEQAQSEADFDIPTEVQILTKRVRDVMESNRDEYSQLSRGQRKGTDSSKYNKEMLRATLLDWKEYFAQK